MDEGLRRLERQAASGDPQAQRALERARHRLQSPVLSSIWCHECGYRICEPGEEESITLLSCPDCGCDLIYETEEWDEDDWEENPDPRRRQLERAASEGDPQAEVDLLRARVRSGELSLSEVSAIAGDEVAMKVFDAQPGDLQLIRAAGKKKRFSGAEAERILRAYYRGLGYTEDRYGAMVSPDGQERIKFKVRAYEVCRGGRGRWQKFRSDSMVQAATRMVAEARQRVEGGGHLEELAVREVKKKRAVRKRRSKKKTEELALRMAVVQASIQLTSEERREILLDEGGAYNAYEREVYALAAQLDVPDGATEESIDSVLSIHAPPVPLKERLLYSRSKVKVPRNHIWQDRGLGMPIRVARAFKGNLEVEIGHVPVDPFRGDVSKEGMARALFGDGEKSGISGSIRSIKGSVQYLLVGMLYMIIAQEQRKGLGTRLVRSWCHLMRAYGTEPIWVAQAVGQEGEAWLRELDRRGEVQITSVRGRDFFVDCELALEDPRQRVMFYPGARRNRPRLR